jgi:hypothetical protein
VGDQWRTWRQQWAVERALERAIEGTAPILAGPWLSEVGYEVLYWAPFLRWVKAAYRIPDDRLVIMSRGGTASWYRDISPHYVEALDHISPQELAARAASGALKQREISELDRQLIERASAAAAPGGTMNVLHPSLMFRWFAPFWSGHETLGFVESHTRYARVQPPDHPAPIALPPEYVAVKFYSARSLPDDPAVRAQLRTIVDGLRDRFPIVQLDTGLSLDDHADVRLDLRDRITSISGRFDPRTNLAMQSRIIAGARMYVGTCGSLAWLAPMLGVPTVPVFTDAAFLHAHLHLARRVYGRLGGGAFSPRHREARRRAARPRRRRGGHRAAGAHRRAAGDRRSRALPLRPDPGIDQGHTAIRQRRDHQERPQRHAHHAGGQHGGFSQDRHRPETGQHANPEAVGQLLRPDEIGLPDKAAQAGLSKAGTKRIAEKAAQAEADPDGERTAPETQHDPGGDADDAGGDRQQDVRRQGQHH